VAAHSRLRCDQRRHELRAERVAVDGRLLLRGAEVALTLPLRALPLLIAAQTEGPLGRCQPRPLLKSLPMPLPMPICPPL